MGGTGERGAFNRKEEVPRRPAAATAAPRSGLYLSGRYGRWPCAWTLAQVSLRPSVRLKTRRPSVESESGQK